jgi:hypothetical protein
MEEVIVKKKRGRKPKSLNVVIGEVIEVVEVPKKKRGRKPKPKVENLEPKIPKKRGRKPKPKTEQDLLPKIPKKRGRKPKNKYSVLSTDGVFDFVNDVTILLHLPLSTEDIQTVIVKSKEQNKTKYHPTIDIINVPEPYEPNSISSCYAPLNKVQDDSMQYEQYSDHEDDNKSEIEVMENINQNCSMNIDSSSISSYGPIINLNDNNIVASYVPIVNMNGDSVIDYSENICINDMNANVTMTELEGKVIDETIIKHNLRNIMYEFIDGNRKNSWPLTTNVYCMWDCHPFNTHPCAVPKKYINDIFYLFGNFCSYSCVASYIFHNKTNDMWEQYSLLNLLYRKIYNTSTVQIKCSPPREVLKIFGGFLSIDEFREKVIVNDTTYKVLYPPMVSIIPQIEENIIDTMNKKDKELYQLGKTGISNSIKSLRLKRDKSLINNNESLSKFMNIKVM